MFGTLYSISLRRKVIIGAAVVYLFMTATILGSYYSMRSLEDKISYLENVSKLEESVLEIRRFEKNYFLYGNKDSLTTALYHLKRVEALIADNTAKIESLSSPGQIAEFKASLAEYGQLLGQCSNSFVKDSDGKPDCESAMRKTGNAMAQFGETVAKRKRDSIKETMRATVTLPLFGLIVVGCGLVAIGSFLFTKVTRSLLLLEDGTTRIAQGAFKPIETLPAERDIRNILIAFNSMALQLQDREEQLVQSKKLASLGTMLAGVAHEVNNPLSNISSACEILLEELDEADKEFQRKFLKNILVQVEKARTLILNLLEFSRAKELNLESVSLKGIVERTLESLSGEKPTDLRVTVQIDPAIRVHVDRGKMEQAFTNLISNAFQAIDGDGEVKIRALAKKDGIVKVRISDSGKGIPEENLPKIFDPFFTTKDVGKGTGLGLFITHDIVLRHKGMIQVKSSPEKGTTFTIQLPAVENS
ncbi:ATP-binding protein [Desulfomonile tiedjei]|uniref:histidine kinase n=1 Tax=Desulfomonile tiedjei (strain ATCC 49306 / DSM 6799 / DCB-1) TaxID=706587 RepID=I4C1J6_DESTA|nr:ATP-binding protein [Desulfomonile tiedjei]AFM23437.1 signal transduction histidine kinase [Desulfomonile tiedjei DSM 6799]